MTGFPELPDTGAGNKTRSSSKARLTSIHLSKPDFACSDHCPVQYVACLAQSHSANILWVVGGLSLGSLLTFWVCRNEPFLSSHCTMSFDHQILHVKPTGCHSQSTPLSLVLSLASWISTLSSLSAMTPLCPSNCLAG